MNTINKTGWKEIKDYPNYSVNSSGQVLNTKLHRLMNHGFRDNRVIVRLTKNKVTHRVPVARLVAYAFSNISAENYGGKVGYLDGDVKNVNASNLSWYKTGFADRSPNANHTMSSAKLNDEKVREILQLLESGNVSKREIAKMYDVSKSTIHQIHFGISWKHVKI